MTNKKPTTFTREEVVNHIKADILNAVLNEIVADDEGHISDSRGGILLSEAKEKVSKMVTEAVEEVKRITDIGELMVEAMVSIRLVLASHERMSENEVEL